MKSLKIKTSVILVVLFGLALMNWSLQQDEITVYMIGDSTMANKPYKGGNPEKGWGQVFGLYFKDQVKVDNHAVNGRSTKSFIDEGRWNKVFEQLKKGDYVIIEFGHNDQKEDEKRHTDPEKGYRENYTKFIVCALDTFV